MTGVLAALALGAATGAVLQRFQLCFNSAARAAALDGERTGAATFGVAVAVGLALLPILSEADLVRLSPPPFEPVAQLVGGLAFGFGMALAGGCISGILFRSGEGSIAAMLAAGGFAAGELVLRRTDLEVLAAHLRGAPGATTRTLPELLGVAPVAIGLVAAALVLTPLSFWTRRALLPGLVLGGVATAAWMIARAADYGYGLGFVGVPTRIVDAGPWFQPTLALGTVVGAFLAARASGGATLRRPDAPRAARAVIGGCAMGVAGTIAAGCNIGHLVSGVPQLSLGSVWATAWMALGAIAGALLLRARPSYRGRERPVTSRR